jgi:hypothetical protein
MAGKKKLSKFFAVTSTSIYEVKSNDGTGNPVAKKIALKGESLIKVGDCLRGGTMIAICEYLVVYFPEKYGFCHPMTGIERRIEMVNTFYWGGRTSLIVALFKTKKEAHSCFQDTKLQPCDQRWVEQTKNVLAAIGNDHPVFEICRFKDMALPCTIEK